MKHKINTLIKNSTQFRWHKSYIRKINFVASDFTFVKVNIQGPFPTVSGCIINDKSTIKIVF